VADYEPCECGSTQYDLSATLIACKRCGRLWGRVNGARVLDPDSVPAETNAAPSTFAADPDDLSYEHPPGRVVGRLVAAPASHPREVAMTAPNPFTAAELDEIERYFIGGTGTPQHEIRLLAMARRAIELEARVAELLSALAEIHRTSGRGDGHGTPAETAACVVDAIVSGAIDSAEGAEREKQLEQRIDELETRLAEREGLERRLQAWLRGGDDSEDRHMLREIGAGFEHVSLCWEKEDLEGELIGGMTARVSGFHEGEGLDYWQAVRAALDEVEAEKASGK
jgi:hypothetical protein